VDLCVRVSVNVREGVIFDVGVSVGVNVSVGGKFVL